MPYSIRLILIGVAWLLCAAVIYPGGDPFADPRFGSPDPNFVPQLHASPFFRQGFVNASQSLPMVHVASLAELGNGTLASLWYGGPYEYSHDDAIYFATQSHGSWSQPTPIMSPTRAEQDLGRPMKGLGNSILLVNPDGSLRLLFVTIAMGKWSGSQLNTSVSRDGGQTWSRTERLTLSPLCNFSELVRNRPIPLIGGGWCVPIYQELLGKFPELLWLKEHNGELIYRKTRVAGGCSTYQPSLIPLGTKIASLILRDYTKAKRIFFSHTEDGGLSWSKPTPTNLPNPDAGISGLRLADGRLLVAFNDSATNRDNLSLAVSSDAGKKWKLIAVLENGPESWFSYPYMMRTSDGLIHIVYTFKGDEIKEAGFNESWLTSQETKGTRQ
jgi:predicted neuraminidase